MHQMSSCHMMRRLCPPYGVLLWYAALLHLYWAVMLWFVPGIVWTTPMAAIFVVLQQSFLLTSAVLAGASVSNSFLIFLRRARPWHLLLGILQQCLLLISAAGCVFFAFQGHYADATPHVPLFIFSDQLATILAALLHSVALILFHQERYFLQRCPWISL